MGTQSHSTFKFPTDEFRSLPLPGLGGKAKLGTCFVQVENLPHELEEWMQVNPRIPTTNKLERLKGPVAKAIIRTLEDEPEKFALKNQGIYLLAERTNFAKEAGGKGVVAVTFSDPKLHGLVNGGHTYLAIRQVTKDQDFSDSELAAFVRLHILEGIDSDDINELAEGLNRSMQVDDPSLENLRGSFEEIKKALKGKPGGDQIAYRQGDQGEIDVQQVLQIMSLFDLDRFPDRKGHPNRIFGHQKSALDYFIEDKDNGHPIFKKILPRLHEILVLSDQIAQGFANHLGQLKISSSAEENRVASPKHKNLPAHFAGGKIGGRIPMAWLFPPLAAFRANVNREAWGSGKLEWLMNPSDLLSQTIEELAHILKQEHQDNRGKIAEVGRKEAAYRGCYSVITVVLAEKGYLG